MLCDLNDNFEIQEKGVNTIGGDDEVCNMIGTKWGEKENMKRFTRS